MGCPGGRPAGPVRPAAAAPPIGGWLGGAVGLGAGFGAIRGGAFICSGGVGDVGRCSSMRSRRVGGTMRPGTTGGFGGGGASIRGAVAATAGSGVSVSSAAGGGGSTGTSTGTSTTAGGACTTIGSGSGASASTATGSTSAGGASTSSSAGAATGAGFAVLTSRGGGSIGAAGFTGSAAFFAGAPGFLPFTTGVSAKMSPLGSEMLRWRASRSTNWRPTTSSIVLDALFTSMPWSRLRSADTSWLVVPSSSATL